MTMKIERVEVFGVAVPLIGEYKNAYLSKSGGPGLGVTLDDAKIAKYRFDAAKAAA